MMESSNPDNSHDEMMNESIETFGSDLDEDDLEMTGGDYSTAEGSSENRSHRNNESIGSACFFADATLPLESAHALAETPEPIKFVLSSDDAVENKGGVSGSSLLSIPSLQLPLPENMEVNPTTTMGGTTTTAATFTTNVTATTVTNLATKDGQSNRRSVSSLNRITNADQAQAGGGGGRPSISSMPSNLQPTYRPRPPRRPRDPMWAMAWLIFVPLSLMFPFYPSPSLDSADDDEKPGWYWVATTHAARSAVLLCILIAFGITQAIARVLYRTMGGGDGDSARQKATQGILTFAPLSAMVHPLVILLIWSRTPSAFGYAIVPLAFFLRDIWALRQWRGMPAAARVASVQGGSSWHDQGRQTFFQALACMALDILSRSLRRQSFYRSICTILLLQLVTVWAWQKCLVYALAEFSNATVKGVWFICVALLGGKWATGTVARFLGYVASGGVTSWFAQQSILMEEMEVMNKDNQSSSSNNNNNKDETNGGGTSTSGEGVDTASDDSPLGYAGNDIAGRATTRAAIFSMPDAYREADASAYQSVLDLDEGIDDDFEDEDGGEYGGTNIVGGNNGRATLEQKTQWTGGGSGAAGGSTVKAFLITAGTVSFGSVAQCGLLGGLAQFTWRTVRNLDAIVFLIAHRFSGGGARGGFRGMQIGRTNRISTATSFFQKLTSTISSTARSFVRTHSDLALSHVAAYYKSYQRAASDVAVLIDASGVEPILHDDITTHMCACVCGSISGMIVIVIGYFLSHNRVIATTGQNLSDKAVVECMFVSYIMCYTLLFTVMEPLRASIKAIYVCFAQHPQSLSQAFPLIFHRLSRIAEANVV